MSELLETVEVDLIYFFQYFFVNWKTSYFENKLLGTLEMLF